MDRTLDEQPRILLRMAPAALAIVPVSLLFGVLATRADWSPLEVLVISLLGFSGSGQFALLPLAESGAGFATMLLVAASINSRYLPIALSSAGRLPRTLVPRACLAHMLGDEAYATEDERDARINVWRIRAILYMAWVLAGLCGALLGQVIPVQWLGSELNLGFPASVVLMYLSVTQLRERFWSRVMHRRRLLAASALCAGMSLLLIHLLGPIYFWIPGIALTCLILERAGL